jgi:hypothetical protein
MTWNPQGGLSVSLAQELMSIPEPGRSKIAMIIDGSLLPAEGSEGLSESDRAQLHDLVLNPNFTTTALAKALQRRGFSIGESSIRRYRQSFSDYSSSF